MYDNESGSYPESGSSQASPSSSSLSPIGASTFFIVSVNEWSVT